MLHLPRRPTQTVYLIPWIHTNEDISKAILQFPSCCSPTCRRRSSLKFGAFIPLRLSRHNLIPSTRDLAVNNDGRLTRDGFAVAMHLIQGKLSGKDIPASLPPTLVPPSMRSNAPTSPFMAVPPPQPAEPLRDLLWDDSPPISTVNTHPQHNIFQPQTTAPPATSPPLASRAPPVSQDPFATAPRYCTFLRLLFFPRCLIYDSAFDFSIPQGSSRGR